VLSRTAFKVTTLPSDVEKYDSDYRNWQLNNWDDGDCGFYEDGTTLKLSSAMTCARSLWVSDTITVQYNSASNKTVITNAPALRVKYGKKTIGASSAVTNNAAANISLKDVESVVITEAENYLSLTFDVCLAEETLSADDELTVHPVVTRNGTGVNFSFNDWEDQLANEDDPGLDVTYTVPTPDEGAELENLSIAFSLDVEELTTAGTYTGSVDVKLNGTSVTEPCPTYDAAWPTLTTINGDAGSAEATTTSSSVPADTFTENDNFDQYSFRPDGFGGMFYWGYEGVDVDNYEQNANTDVTIVHMNGSTPSNTLAGAGEIVINSGRWGYPDMARFGEDGQSWFTLAEGNRGAYTFTSGSMTSSAGSERRSLSGKALDGLCGKGFGADYIEAVSAPTVNPLLSVSCTNGTIRKSVLAKVVAGKVSAVTTLGTGTKSRPCVVPSMGSDTRASGTEAALVFYTRVSARNAEGNCGSWEATISSRSITTVTAGLAVSRTVLATNPWGQEEPAFLEIAAGSTQGTWFGVTNVMTDFYSPHTPTQLFSMTSSAITIESDEIVLDDSADFGDWFLATPLRQVASDRWALMISGSAEFDGENIGRATVATIDPDTGVVTNGDILESTEMGYLSGRIINRFSSDSNGNATFYTMADEDTYKSTVWNFAG
jgi:hypothetical protein